MSLVSILPHTNAALNATSAAFLVAGFLLVKRGDRERHRACMLAATGCSALFLAGYLTYHFAKGGVMTRFEEQGLVRWFYFTILISHTGLAVLVPPLVLFTIRRALRGELEAHRRLARVTFPIWIYVSITGVVVYGMLYHLYPPGA